MNMVVKNLEDVDEAGTFLSSSTIIDFYGIIKNQITGGTFNMWVSIPRNFSANQLHKFLDHPPCI